MRFPGRLEQMRIADIVRTNVWAVRERNETLDGGRPSPWSKKAVAERLGLPERTYGDWEDDPRKASLERASKKKQKFTVDELVHLANVLQCDVATLLQPSRTQLRDNYSITIPGVRPGSKTLSMTAEAYGMWIASLAALPDQNQHRFDQLTRVAHDHGTSGDIRRNREANVWDESALDHQGMAITNDQRSWRSASHYEPSELADASVTELARRALSDARSCIRAAAFSTQGSSSDEQRHAADHAEALYDALGELIQAIAAKHH